MTRAHLVLALPLAAVLLTGCAADPGAERRDRVAALTEAANSGDADRLRDRADALIATVAQQVDAQELAADEAQRLTALAQAVRAKADLIDTALLERQEAEAEAEAERQRLEAERRELEQERQQLEADRKKAEEERKKAEEEAKKDEEEAKKKDEEERKKKDEEERKKKDEDDDD